MSTPRIRPLVIGIIWNGDAILVSLGSDPVKGETFFRPLGGEIEFGERAAEALVREFKEETGADITDLRLLGVLENIFTFNGKPGHEMVHVFEARFSDPGFYSMPKIPVREAGFAWTDAIWITPAEVAAQGPLYPDGLAELVRLRPGRSD